jgi:hypothetical protein
VRQTRCCLSRDPICDWLMQTIWSGSLFGAVRAVPAGACAAAGTASIVKEATTSLRMGIILSSCVRTEDRNV